jgi:curved DNA-binding protein CbpA
MLELVDSYGILQVDPRADPEVIRAAFRSLARKYHPDVAGGSAKRMVALNQAWSVLSDGRARAAYDRGRGVLSSPAPSPAARATEPSWSQTGGRPPVHPQARSSTSVGMPAGRSVRSLDTVRISSNGLPGPRSGGHSGRRSKRYSRLALQRRPRPPRRPASADSAAAEAARPDRSGPA